MVQATELDALTNWMSPRTVSVPPVWLIEPPSVIADRREHSRPQSSPDRVTRADRHGLIDGDGVPRARDRCRRPVGGRGPIA